MRFILVVLMLLSIPGVSASELYQQDLAVVKSFGQWPPRPAIDRSNAASGKQSATAFGKALFADRRLSGDGSMSCATCHDPERWFQEGRAVAAGRKTLKRNTQALVDIGCSRWFGWGGAHDNLWSPSLRAITNPDEMAGSVESIAHLIRTDARYRCGVQQNFALDATAADDEALFVAIGKAIAAYLETLISGPSAFDAFRAALMDGDVTKASTYPAAAKRGLKLFVGHGRCHFCHFGARLTNDEFADVTVPYFIPDGVDKGRYDGIRKLLSSRFTRLGSYSDGKDDPAADFTRYVRARSRNFGEFKVPSLRNVARTAPYMHNGSLATLEEVVRHYSEINEERLHGRVDRLLRPLKLTPAQSADLVAFLQSLNSTLPPGTPGPATFECGL